MNLVMQHIDRVRELCIKCKVERLYVFGSVLTDKFGPESDIDFIVEYKPMPVLDVGDCYFELSEGLEDLFQRKIDLISYKAIKNKFFLEEVDQTKQLIYESAKFTD